MESTEVVDDESLVPVESLEPDPKLLTELRKKRSITPLTRWLFVVMIASATFLAGVLVERSQAKGSNNNSTAASLAALFRQGSGGTGNSAGGSGGSTIGTVKLIDGKNIYVTDTQGNVVKIVTNGDTQISVNRDGKVSDLTASKTVLVQGTKRADGTVVATQISETGALAGAGGGLPGGGSGFPGGAPPTGNG